MALFVLVVVVTLVAPVVVELILEVLLAQVILHQFRLLKAIQAVRMDQVMVEAVEAALVLLVHQLDQTPVVDQLEATEW